MLLGVLILNLRVINKTINPCIRTGTGICITSLNPIFYHIICTKGKKLLIRASPTSKVKIVLYEFVNLSVQQTMTDNSKDQEKRETAASFVWSFTTVFVTKEAYQHVADEFHPFHKHDLNVAVHLLTSGLGVWGAIQLAMVFNYIPIVYAYAIIIAMTTPLMTPAAVHTVFVYGCMMIDPSMLASSVGITTVEPWIICLAAIALGFSLQELSHYLCCEGTYMGHYMDSANKENFKPWMLIIHSIWLMPLVIDSVLMRNCFLSWVPTRNRNIVCPVASRKAIEDLHAWIAKNVPESKETTHLWPHKQEETTGPTLQLEKDAGIYAAFRKVFAAKHFDVLPVQDMNEIYITAVGAKKEINSDAVFYMPHTDGPYWWLPGASLYRVLVGITPNKMVCTHFNLQHETQDQVLDQYGVVGFDYNRELHWIDHVPGVVNTERRSVLKLHFIVYPAGWHSYGKFCATLNSGYNTWARGNFVKTLRPAGIYEIAMAWWIWCTTFCNATFEEYFGWSNVVYVAFAYSLGPTAFLVLTSFRHYVVYMTTFAFREPMVAHGYLMRDAKLYKTMSMLHLAYRLLPMVQLPGDLPGLAIACAGFATTLLATSRLGMVRTYFGTELGFVKPCWIEGFPYGTIPHPMINGQIFAFVTILLWWRASLTPENTYLLIAHISFYTAHMLQEIFAGAY